MSDHKMPDKTAVETLLFTPKKGDSPADPPFDPANPASCVASKSMGIQQQNRPQERTTPASRSRGAQPGGAQPMTLEQAEEVLVRRALAKHQGDRGRAAQQLGLSTDDLLEKILRFGL